MLTATVSPSARRLAATPVIWGLCAALDGLPGGAMAALCAGGLGVLLGGLFGLIWVGAGSALRRLPRPVAVLPWLGIGVALGLWLVDALGALSRLGGPHHALALMALGGAVACGLATAIALAASQPSRVDPDGLLGRRWPVMALLLALAALGAAWIDRTRFVGLYPEAHDALRFTGLLLLSVAAGLVRRPPLPRTARLALALVGVGWIAVPFVALHRGADETLQHMLDRPLPGFVLDGARALTDVDRDGASSLLGGGDDEPFAAARMAPVVLETAVADNPAVTGPSPTDVVLITIDTLRPDRMSLYGHDRPTTPALDAFAAGGLRFDRAISPGGWTSLAISSLMRGVAPRKLRWTKIVETSDYALTRWRDRATLDRKLRLRMMFGLPLDDPRPTLAERLADRDGHGMHTMAVVDDGYGQFLSPKMGADRGFADFRAVDGLPKARRNDAGTTDLALAALDARPKDQRFFLWVHYFGPHDPTRRQAGVPWYGDGIADGYDHEVRFTDKQVGRLLERLEDMAREAPLAVIVSSDHGEIFFEKRRMHGLTLQPAVVRIPLIVSGAGIEPGVSDAPASLLDIHPTILALTETPPTMALDGLDLRRVAAERPARVLVTDTWRYDRHGRPVYDHAGATDGRHLLRLDRVRNVRVLWSLDDLDARPTDIRATVPHRHIEAGLDRYLKVTGGGRVLLVE